MNMFEMLEQDKKPVNKIIGIERDEIDELNRLDLIGFLLDFDKANYRQRNNGTLVKYGKSELVIYHDHSYQFNTTVHKYKDNIGTLRALYGWGFMEAVNHLRQYRDKENYKPTIPNYNKFD